MREEEKRSNRGEQEIEQSGRNGNELLFPFRTVISCKRGRGMENNTKRGEREDEDNRGKR